MKHINKEDLLQKAAEIKAAIEIKSPEELRKAAEYSMRGVRAVLFGEKAFRTDLVVFVLSAIAVGSLRFYDLISWGECALMIYTVFMALVGEIILFEQGHHLFDAHLFLGGHELQALLVQGGVHADGHMAEALIEKAFELVLDTHAAHGDAFRAPGISPVGGEHLGGAQHLVEVVHWFTLSHEHHVGEPFGLGQRVYLVEDVGGCELSLKSLLAGLAEEAVHLAAHLA